MDNQIAIIGAGGFIGRRLTSALAGDKNNKLQLYGRRGHESATQSITPLDFSDVTALRKVSQTSDIVYYLASETIPATSWEHPFLDIDKNLRPFLNFLEAAAGTGLKKVVFISSAGTVYGTTKGKVKEDADKKPFSPYGIIKLTMEHFLEHYRQRLGIQYDVYRVSNVYGSGQNTGKGLGIINTFLEKIIKGEEIVVFGDGSATRNYVYVEDVTALLVSSIKDVNSTGVYNLSSDSTASINELISEIRKTVREKVVVRTEQGRGSDNSFIDLDNSALKKLHPDFKFTGLAQGIALTYQSLKAVQSQTNV